MRVALIAPPWVTVPPTAYGGTEAVIDGLARGLVAAGHDVLLFTTEDSSCPVPKAWHFPEALGTGRTDGELSELRHVITAYELVEGFDVVHDHTLAGPFVCATHPRSRVVTTNHGPFGEGLEEVYKALAPRVPVIAISHAQAADAASKGIEIAAVIHHGIDLSSLEPGSGDGGYALFLGRMSPSKGVDAAARVARATGVPLRIAGKLREPAELEYFESRVRPLLGGDVEYVGEVSPIEKSELLKGAFCLLNPIAWPEPFGMVMIEALASGTPVVATPCGAAQEIVEHGVTGFLGTSEADLTRAVMSCKDLDRSTCRKSAEERFGLERMVSEHVELYEQVAAGR